MAAANESVGSVSPSSGTPFFIHWSRRGMPPPATTVNVAGCPGHTDTLGGLVTTVGGPLAMAKLAGLIEKKTLPTPSTFTRAWSVAIAGTVRRATPPLG